MCDSSLLKEYGLIGGFDTVCNMLGEQIAVVTNAFLTKNLEFGNEVEKEKSDDDNEDNEEENGDDMSDDEEAGITTEGIMYCELQSNSQALATQLFYRFGARRGDKILVTSEGHVGAEIVAILACMRLGVAFVPFDSKPFRNGTTNAIEMAKSKIAQMISNLKPTVAIVVGSDDNDLVVKMLTSLGHYRCALLDANGNIVELDATVTSCLVGTLPDYNPMDDDEKESEPLYILHTSGSTGESKGVIGTYHGLINRIAWQYDQFPFEFQEMVLRRTPLTFIDSLAEIFAPLLRGIPICGYLMQRINEDGLMSVIEDAESLGISRITLIPSQLHVLCKTNLSEADKLLGEQWSSLKYVFISGEECPAILIKEFRRQFPHTNLINLYGSTEVAGDVTYKLLCQAKDSEEDGVDEEFIGVDKQGQVSIGQTIPGNIILIVQYDATTQMYQVLPPNEIGEIMVVGSHVAKGYNSTFSLNHNFLSSPSLDYSLLQNRIRQEFETTVSNMLDRYPIAYLMGDLAYGQVVEDHEEYTWVGRKDRQVKLRGNRIELEDIERQLRTLFEVADGIFITTVSASDVSHIPSLAEQTNLVLLILLIDQQAILPKGISNTVQLKGYLHEHLIDLYVPDIVFIQEANVGWVSKSSNLKSNRQQMKQMVIQLITQSLMVPSAETEPLSVISADLEEQDIASICEVLWQFCVAIVPQAATLTKSPSLSFFRTIDFFALGGNSISSIELLWKIKQHFASPASSTLLLHQHHLQKSLYELAQYIHQLLNQQAVLKNIDDKSLQESDSPPKKRSKPSHSTLHILHQPNAISSTTLWQEGKSRGHCEYNDSLSSVGDLSIKWSMGMKKCIDSSPLLCVGDSDIVLIGSHGGDVKCMNAQTGSLYWELDIQEHIESAISCSRKDNICFVSSFLGKDVDGFVPHGDDEHLDTEHRLCMGKIHALDISTGEIKWQFQTMGECKATVAVDEHCVHRVYAGCYHGMVYALDLLTGQLLDQEEIIGSVYATPILSPAQDLLYVVTTQGYCYAFQTNHPNKPLNLVWTYSTDQTPVFATPVLIPNQPEQIVLALTDGSLQCITCPTTTTPSEENLEDNEPLEAKVLWHYYEITTAPIFAMPNIFNYTVEGEEIMLMVLGSHDGILRVVHLLTGQVLFQEELGGVIFGAPYCVMNVSASVLQVIVATTPGEIVVLEILLHRNSENYKEEGNENEVPILVNLQALKRMKFAGEIFSSPVILKDSIFVGCRDDQFYSIAWKS